MAKRGVQKPAGSLSPSMIFSIFLSFSSILLQVSGVRYDGAYWREQGRRELEASLRYSTSERPAKNVVLFIGDGMGPNTVTATRIRKYGETGLLSWEKFDNLGVLKTYCADKQVPDSGCTATAMFTGEKSNYYTLGLSSNVVAFDCPASLKEENQLTSVATDFQNLGMSTGVVTTATLTDATPAALYAHTPYRNWVCDGAMRNVTCKDIARQLVEDLPGKRFNVILGGGGSDFGLISKTNNTQQCIRKDGRNLTEDWVQDKKSQNFNWDFVKTTKQLQNVDIDKIDYLLGIFNDWFFPYEHERDQSEDGCPSLSEMTTTAIKLLNKNPKGFFLTVEGGLIDRGHHLGVARLALDETSSFDDAVEASLDLLANLGIKDDTLVIVTSDHTHTLSINGYPTLGNDILGIAQNSSADGIPFTTLSYGAASISNYKYTTVNGRVEREDPSKVNTSSFDYHQQGAFPAGVRNTHGGGDVVVYATGPMAHLFQRVHEQNYVASVIRYAVRKNTSGIAASGARLLNVFPSLWISTLLLFSANYYDLIY